MARSFSFGVGDVNPLLVAGRRTLAGAGIALGVALLAGCAVPSARYNVYSAESRRSAVKADEDVYALTKTLLKISEGSIDEEGNRTFNVEVVRAESPDVMFGVTPKRRWHGVVTTLSIAKVENTSLVESITSEVKDGRVAFVKSAAKLLGVATGVPEDAALGGTAPEAPRIHDLQDRLAATSAETIAEISLGEGLELTVLPVPYDALPIRELNVQDFSRMFIYSACRQATLRVTADDNVSIMQFAVADPRYVQMVAFPRKGKITAHSECGVSVAPENVELTSDIDVLTAALEELKKLSNSENE